MTQIRRILFPTDLTPESDRAFEHARLLAEAFGAHVTLYHAVEHPLRSYAQWTEDREDALREAVAVEARREVERRAALLMGPHEVLIQSNVSAVPALVDLAVLDLIHQRRPDLTVMATRGRRGFASFFLGSVTEQVVQHAGLPVLCVRASEHGGPLPYRHLLVATDFSPASRRAFALSALLARRFEARVTALHVAPPAGVVGADELREFLAPEFDGLTVEARVERAAPVWRQIVESALGLQADLVALATSGHDSVRDGILGSTTDRVLRHAPCPVLVA
jgi:nucleotide-binding universal stress UspA family protein